MSLRSATASSVNTVYAQLGLDVGPENFVEMAHKLGITRPLDGYAAEALGGLTHGVSLLEMSNAYATFANGGVHHNADRDRAASSSPTATPTCPRSPRASVSSPTASPTRSPT